MYITTASKNQKGHETLEKLLADDSIQSQHDVPDVIIVRMDSLSTKDHRKVAVRSFEHSQFEIVAYVDENEVVAMLVLSALDKTHLDQAYPAFKDLVGSYFFLSENLNISR
jgi:hypothetical protein